MTRAPTRASTSTTTPGRVGPTEIVRSPEGSMIPAPVIVSGNGARGGVASGGVGGSVLPARTTKPIARASPQTESAGRR